MDSAEEVNVYLSRQMVFSHAIRPLWTSQSPSCELNNQWLLFWLPRGYLAENRVRGNIACSPRKKQQRKNCLSSLALEDPKILQNHFLPWPTFFSPMGDKLSLTSRGTDVNWEWHPEMLFSKGSLHWEITALNQSSKTYIFCFIYRLFFGSWKKDPFGNAMREEIAHDKTSAAGSACNDHCCNIWLNQNNPPPPAFRPQAYQTHNSLAHLAVCTSSIRAGSHLSSERKVDAKINRHWIHSSTRCKPRAKCAVSRLWNPRDSPFPLPSETWEPESGCCLFFCSMHTCYRRPLSPLCLWAEDL